MEINWTNIEAEVQRRIQQTVKETDTKAKSCAVRAANELRNAALNVLRGQRSGRTYRKPGTRATYTASAPGEPPAVRTGMLRMSWGISAVGTKTGEYTAGIYSDVPYAKLLDEGTPGGKIAPRPYKEKIIETARPKVVRIFSELETE